MPSLRRVSIIQNGAEWVCKECSLVDEEKEWRPWAFDHELATKHTHHTEHSMLEHLKMHQRRGDRVDQEILNLLHAAAESPVCDWADTHTWALYSGTYRCRAKATTAVMRHGMCYMTCPAHLKRHKIEQKQNHDMLNPEWLGKKYVY